MTKKLFIKINVAVLFIALASDNFSLCPCVSSWQNVVLETPSAVGTNTEAILSTLPGV